MRNLRDGLYFFHNAPYRLIFFVSALVLYGVFGSPTPDDPGVAEAAIGGLLVLAAGPAGIWGAFERRQAGWAAAYQMLLFYGVVAGVSVGLVSGYSAGAIARDLAAFFFVLLPLFFVRLVPAQVCVFLIVFIGLCFAVRALLPVYGFYPAPDELLYLANSPLVLCAALILVLSVGADFYAGRVSGMTLVRGCLALLPLGAMLIDVQRAPVVSVLVSVGVLGALYVYNRPGRMAVTGFVLLMIAVAAFPLFESIGHEILVKTGKVGLNMRSEELAAVFSAVDGSWMRALFGLGWGATFEAPSVGGLPVAYTHSFLSYMMLKGGLIGLALAGLLFVQGLVHIVRVMQAQPMWGLSVLWPFVIPVVLYASHKSLDFGLIGLCVYALAALYGQQAQDDAEPEWEDSWA